MLLTGMLTSPPRTTVTANSRAGASRRNHEFHINSSPQYITSVGDDDDKEYNTHFAALFPDRLEAIPVPLLHGWLGGFIKFLPIFNLLHQSHTPFTLPYHLVVSTLLGYALSSASLGKILRTEDLTRIFDKLAHRLCFEIRYAVQSDDVKGKVARVFRRAHKLYRWGLFPLLFCSDLASFLLLFIVSLTQPSRS